MIGIAVSTYNRNEALEETLLHIERFRPLGSKVVVVDDASDNPSPHITHQMDNNGGTLVVKNKCIELLYEMGCEHFFLFDDDCYPIKKGWEKVYTDHNEPHLCYSFSKILEVVGDIKLHKRNNGCMMYIHKSVIDKIGGFDTGFKGWGRWHNAYSRRAYNSRLTSYRYMDVVGSNKYIHSMDEHSQIDSTRDTNKPTKNSKRSKKTMKSSKYHCFRSN